MKHLFSNAFHLHIDGQTEVTNISLGNLLKCLTKDHVVNQDLILPQVEFAYNNYVNQITCITQFELVYGFNSKILIDVTSLPLPQKTNETRLDFAVFMSNLHESVKCKMADQVIKYATQDRHTRELYFKEVDLFLVIL